METLSFTTPARRRERHPVEVHLCGETFTVTRPKDAVLYFVSQVAGSDVPDADRAMAIMQFIDSALDPVARKRLYERILDRDDPVDLHACLDMVGQLLQRWNDDEPTTEPVLVERDSPPARLGEPVRVRHDQLALDITAHPPKDIVVLFVAASLSTGANLGQMAWAVSLFLDAALDTSDSLYVSRRMRSHDDDLDLEHIAEIARELLTVWSPKTNRAQRRAASRGRRTTSGTSTRKKATATRTRG